MTVKLMTIIIILVFILTVSIFGEIAKPVWPSHPDPTRVEWIGEINIDALNPHSGLLGRLKKIIAGRSSAEKLSLPFDILVNEKSIFLTCQTIPVLVEVNKSDNSFRLYNCDEVPFEYPIALTSGEGKDIYITDSKSATVYRFDGKKVTPFISNGLNRPTGICANIKEKKLYIVDTGDHSVKIYSFDGQMLGEIGEHGDAAAGFNFPTFISSYKQNRFIVIDAMNYQIKQFDNDGKLYSAFGEEGDGPGTFSRPKGLAVDRDNHIWVVDNLFDNVQLFDEDGRILLVIGSSGQQPGQFWSPAGIDIYNDTVYIADTFNNRIQILHYLGDNSDD
jgi:hypothetical protein